MTNMMHSPVRAKWFNIGSGTSANALGEISGGNDNFQVGIDGQTSITIDDTNNAVGLTITQNDVTNNLNAVNIVNTAESIDLSITHSGTNAAFTALDVRIPNIAGESGGPAAAVFGNVANTKRAVFARGNNVASHHLYRNLPSTQTTGAVVFVQNDNASDDQSALFVQNDGTGDGIVVDQNGDTGSILSTDGAIFVENTGNPGMGLNVYSNQSGAAVGPLVTFVVDNSLFDSSSVLRIVNDSDTSSGILIDQATATSVSVGLQITNAGLGNSISVDANGAVGSTRATDGAIFVENTGNTGIGLSVYSNIGATANGVLTSLYADNVAFDQTVLYVENDGTANSVVIVGNNSGDALYINQTSNGTSINIDTAGDVIALDIDRVINDNASTSTALVSLVDNVGFTGAGTFNHSASVLTIGDDNTGSGGGTLNRSGQLVEISASGTANGTDTLTCLAITNLTTTGSGDVFTITSGSTGNAISITQSGNTGAVSSTDGAIFVENTGNTGTGLQIYSNIAGGAAGPLVNFHADNAAFDDVVMLITQDGSTTTGGCLELDHNGTNSSSTALVVTTTTPALEAGGPASSHFTNDAGTNLATFVRGHNVSSNRIYRNLSSTSTTAELLEIHNANASDDQTAVTITNDSTTGSGLVITTAKTSISGAANTFNTGNVVTGAISALFGSGSTVAFTADQWGGAVRFNGAGVLWGDLSYYSTGGDDTEQGHFRFSTTGSTLNTTPDATLGVGRLYTATQAMIGTTTRGSNMLNISTASNFIGVNITNGGTGNGITVDQNGNVGTSETTDGAIFVENTGQTGFGLNVYSNQGATQASALVSFVADNTAFDNPILALRNDGAGADLKIGNATTTIAEANVFSSADAGILVTTGKTSARMYIRGNTQADIMFDNATGGVDTKVTQVVQAGDQFRIRTLTDAGAFSGTPFTLNNSTGQIDLVSSHSSASTTFALTLSDTNAGAGVAGGIDFAAGTVAFDFASAMSSTGANTMAVNNSPGTGATTWIQVEVNGTTYYMPAHAA